MIAIGKLVKAVGLKGEIKLYPYSPEPSCYEGCQVFIDGAGYTLDRFRQHKGMGFMKLAGYETIEDIEHLIDQEVFMQRDDIVLEEDEYLITELIGTSVVTEDGEKLGLIQDVLSHGGNDILVVQGQEEILIPMVAEFVTDIDLTTGIIVVRLIEGLR